MVLTIDILDMAREIKERKKICCCNTFTTIHLSPNHVQGNGILDLTFS